MNFTQPSPQQITILKFLRVETFSTPSIIQTLLKQKTVQASYQILNRMVTEKFLTKYKLPVLHGRGVLLYGITNFGLAYAWDLQETPKYRPTFQPSKVSVVTLQHKFDIQMTHIQALHNGWSNWTDGSQLGYRDTNQKIPDAVVTSPCGQTIAFEIEREIKSVKRYKQILLSHLLNRRKGHWSSILYLCPTNDLALRLRRVFENLGAVDLNGKKIMLTSEHLQHFEFYGYEEFIKKIAMSFNETPSSKLSLHTAN
jgi:hypothetical protein